MIMILENSRATVLHYENRIDAASSKFQVQQKFSTRVNYIGDTRCVCVYAVDITDTDNALPFRISAEITGFFSYDDGMDQADIHIEAARQLFPHLKASVSLLTSLAGAPPFILQHHEVKREDIVASSKEPNGTIN